jgi:MFS family permease
MTTEATRSRIPLFALMTAVVVGLLGRQLSVIAIPWFVLTTTGSASRAGIVGAAVMLPGFIVGILGGVVVDRLGYRKVSIVSDLVCAVSTLAIPALYITVGLQFWQLLVLVFFSSLLDIPALTARRSMIPELTEQAGMSLDRANATFESLQNLALLLGTPVAGVLVAVLGARNVLWLDGGASLVSALIVALAIPASRFGPRVVEAGASYWAELMVGFRFIRRDAILWPMVIILAVSNGTSAGVSAVVLPVYFRDQFDSPAGIGVVLAAMGGGAFLGATLYGIFASRMSRWLVWVVVYMLVPLEFWVFLVSPSLALLVAAFFVVGVLVGPINPLMVTLRHERAPAAIRGRVFSTYSAIAFAVAPLGILVTGNLVEGIGFNPTVIILAAIAQVLGVVSVLLPGLRQMKRTQVKAVVPVTRAVSDSAD